MEWFTSEKLTEHITRITEITGVFQYLVEGTKRALLIDTGCGVGDLAAYVESLTKLPVTVACTHGHMDHAGGAAQFDEVYLHPADVEMSWEHCSLENRREYARMVCAALYPELEEGASDSWEFHPVRKKAYQPLLEGMEFDLGGFTVRMLPLKGHTQGSMCMLFCEERSILFGDACNPSVFLFDKETDSVEEYLEALRDFQKYEDLYDTVYLSHGDGTPVPKRILQECMTVCREILEGRDEKVPFDFMGGSYRAAHAVYSADGANMRTDGGLGNIIYNPGRILKPRANVNENGNIYGRWQIAEDTWCITDHWQNFLYLLIGEEKAMLIDTGCGEGNVREVVEQITENPVMVVNTHGHFDHTGGNSCWAEAWMTEAAAVHAKEPFGPVHKAWFFAKQYPDYEIHFLQDKEVIELGGRAVEVLSIPAHSEGSIALLDRKTRFLFCGDEIESGQVIWFVRNEAVPLEKMAEMHRESMKKLQERIGDYDWLWPAHNGAPLNPAPYLEDFIALDEAVMEGTQYVTRDTAGFHFPPDTQACPNLFRDYGKLLRAEKGLASVVYAEGESIYHNC